MTTPGRKYQTMDRETLKGKLDNRERLHLWNVLGQNYYQPNMNIAGSRWVALDTITESLAAGLVAAKGEMIVVYCGSDTGPSSKLAAGKLTEMGYTNVWAFEGGLKDWTDGGLPTVKL